MKLESQEQYTSTWSEFISTPGTNVCFSLVSWRAGLPLSLAPYSNPLLRFLHKPLTICGCDFHSSTVLYFYDILSRFLICSVWQPCFFFFNAVCFFALLSKAFSFVFEGTAFFTPILLTYVVLKYIIKTTSTALVNGSGTRCSCLLGSP